MAGFGEGANQAMQNMFLLNNAGELPEIPDPYVFLQQTFDPGSGIYFYHLEHERYEQLAITPTSRASAFEEDNALVTDVLVAGVYVDLNTTLESHLPPIDFTVLNNTLTYTGFDPVISELAWHFSLTTLGGGGSSFAFKVFVNDVAIGGRSVVQPDPNDFASGSLVVGFELDPNDVIQLRVTNLTNATDVTVTDHTVFVQTTGIPSDIF